ncbi:MAG: HAMP domain-containing histidine kinase [Chitinophagaceae bacterium]|nr:HAMP domain-containing histidine kinase [Chitinophagaceae bacterium]
MIYSCDRSVVLPVAFLFLMSAIFSCHSTSREGVDHHAYFDTVFARADNMGSEHMDRVFVFLDSVYRVFPNPGIGDLCRKYFYKQRYYYETRKDYPQAMIYVDSMLTALKGKENEEGFVEEYARALFVKGDILVGEGKHKDAFLYFYQGKQAIEKTGDTCLFGEYNGRLGAACYKEARYGEARRYFKEAFDDMDYCRGRDAFLRFIYQQANLDNIALCYDRAGVTDSASYYYDSALRYIEKEGPQFLYDGANARFVETAKGVIIGNMGDVRLKGGDKEGAEALYRESIRINVQKDHANEDAQLTRAKLVHMYLESGRFKEARGELEQLRKSLDSLPSNEAELRWRRLQWRYSDSIRQPQQAYHYLQSYIKLRDSMAAVDKPADVNEELQHIADNYELELLKKQDEIKTGYLRVAIIFVLMAVVIILQVVQNWRRTRRNVAELTALNQRIQVQNDHMQKTLYALEQSQQDNTRMMKIVAHDLRNPIGASGSVAALLLKKQDLPKDQRAMLELIHTSSQNSLGLIGDLLHVHTKAEELKKEPVDMESVLKYCVDLLRHKAEAKKQRLVLHTMPMTVPANREKMWRVVSNLISNAIKFSPEDSEIEVDMSRAGDMMRISVKDQGIGIPEEIQEKIFDLFTEAKRRGTAGEESFGLGLSISKQIVEAHGGRIWYETTPGAGTIFFIELPGGD